MNATAIHVHGGCRRLFRNILLYTSRQALPQCKSVCKIAEHLATWVRLLCSCCPTTAMAAVRARPCAHVTRYSLLLHQQNSMHAAGHFTLQLLLQRL
jgi:hypothetical protein